MNEITEILFAEVANSKPIEVLRVGTFTDKNGKTVTIDEADLDAYAANFAAGLAGQDVPLDINHERDKAGGWIKQIWREGAKLLAEPEWNELGQQLITDKIYRYLSATIDLSNKVIRSVSLVNFPAVKGLAPLELSTGDRVFSLSPGELSIINQQDDNQEVDMSTSTTPEGAEGTLSIDRDAIETEVRAQVLAELEAAETKAAELRESIRAEVEAELAEKFERRQGLTEFANQICSGEAALSTPPSDVIEFLASLDEGQLEQAKAILQAKTVNLTGGENGSSREGKPEGLLDLPAEVVADLREGELTLADMVNHRVIDGKVEDYDTSMLTSEQIGV